MPARRGRAGGTAGRGQRGRGKTPHQSISTPSKVAWGSKRTRSETHRVRAARGACASCSPGKGGPWGVLVRPFPRAPAELGHSHPRREPNPFIYGRKMGTFCSSDKCTKEGGDGRCRSLQRALPSPPSGDAPRVPRSPCGAPSPSAGAKWQMKNYILNAFPKSMYLFQFSSGRCDLVPRVPRSVWERVRTGTAPWGTAPSRRPRGGRQ